MTEFKFFYVPYGCMGYVGNHKYSLFATYKEYYEWWIDQG